MNLQEYLLYFEEFILSDNEEFGQKYNFAETSNH
jgi:hypothetical protein